jgi:CheY-like chemotaxis protein
MKLKKILLIDDDDTVNFISKKLIEKSGFAETIVAKNSGREALDYLFPNSTDNALPELIFVDINMPEMDGWSFVEELSSLFSDLSKTKIILLTSLINPSDLDRVANIPAIFSLKEKPISLAMLEKIQKETF